MVMATIGFSCFGSFTFSIHPARVMVQRQPEYRQILSETSGFSYPVRPFVVPVSFPTVIIYGDMV